MATTLNNKVGVTRIKLASLLTEALSGVEVLPEKLNSNFPWLSNVRNDGCSWDGWGRNKATGLEVHIYSWDTMTECVEFGIVVEKDQDEHNEYEVLARRGGL